MLIWIISEFHSNFTLKMRKRATAPSSVQKIVQTMGPDVLYLFIDTASESERLTKY